MTITLVKLLEGLIVKDASSELKQINDGIDALSNENVLVSAEDHIVEYVDTDANSITILNSDGTVASGSKANVASRTFKTVEIDMPLPYIKSLYIGRDKYEMFGINPSMLDMNAQRFGIMAANSLVSNGPLAVELKKLYNDFYQFRRNQVHSLLAGLATSTTVYQNTGDADKLVADNRTGHLYDFDNKGTAALSEAEFKVGLNAVAKQIDERGNEFGFHGAKYLFHTSDAVLAQNLINPSGTVNVQYRTVSDLIPGMKFGGVYNNSTDANDWVLITEGHKIQRIIKAGYETPQVRIVHDTENDRIIIEVSDRTIMKCTCPLGIYGAIVS